MAMNYDGRLDLARGDLDAQPRRRWLRIALIVAAVLIVLLVAASVLRHKTPAGAPADASGQSIPEISVMVPGRSQVAGSISATGALAARREMPVGVAGEGGKVSRVLVEAGDWVKAGQTLATIDQSVQVQQAAQLSASIKAAQAQAALAQSDLDRANKLVSRGFISRADIDTKTANRDAANAQVQVARAQLAQTQAQIGRLDVRAPAAGLVLTRGVEAGQVVSSGSPALFNVAENGAMEMMAKLPEGDMAKLRVGMPADVTPVGTSTTLHGTIWQLSPVIDPTTRQGFARIALGYSPAIRPGGFASAAIHAGSVDAPLLPESAVLSDDTGNYVYMVGAKNKVERRNVTIGRVSSDGITVASGLSGQEHVVVSAGPFLNPGDTVKPKPVAAATALAR